MPDLQNQNTFAIASLVLGILAIIVGVFFYPVVGLILGIVGIVLGSKARKEAPSSMATAGFVLSIVGTVISGIYTVCIICGIGLLTGAVASMDAEELAELTSETADFFRLI